MKQKRLQQLLTVIMNKDEGISDPIGDALRADAVAYWKMDETSGMRADATGNGHNATEDGGTINSEAGKINYAARFEVDERFFSLADNSGLSVTSTDSFTFAFWINVHTFPNPNSNSFIYNENVSFEIEYEVDIFAANTLSISIEGSSHTYPNIESGVLSVDTWHFIIAEFEHGVGLRIRINNGTPNSQSYALDNVSGGVGSGSIGYTQSGGVYGLDEIGFWKRILASDERAYLYNSGAGRSLYP